MRIALTLLVLFWSTSAQSQDLNENGNEQMINFTSLLIDYEIYNDQIVAITKKNKEYFIYFTDTKGAKLFEVIDIFFATDLEIDCMGNLFVVGLDSAIQVSITDFVQREQTISRETYESSIRNCRAIFEEALVRESINNSLIYEPIDDSIYTENPVLYTIQIWTIQQTRPIAKNPNHRRGNLKDPVLVENRKLNIQNDGFSQPIPDSRVRTSKSFDRVYKQTSDLSAFQVDEDLWVIDETNKTLYVRDQFGRSKHAVEISGLDSDFKIHQDRQTQIIYFALAEGSKRNIQAVNEKGRLMKGTPITKGITRSSFKISNGYLYFRDSKGVGESIKRVKLN